MARQTMNYSLQREFKLELEEYTLNKHVLNLICDMGYAINERDHKSAGIRGSKTSSLVKQTHKHVIVVNYDYRRRIMPGPEEMSQRYLD